MDQPRKGRLPRRTKEKSKPEMEMLGNLVNGIVEQLKDEAVRVEDPFDDYMHELKIRVYQDLKIFRSRFIQGYETLVEHLCSQTPPEKQ